MRAKNKTDLWVLPLESGGKPWPFLETEFAETQGQFSPDGRWLAYTSDESGRSEVYVQPFTGAPSGSGGKWQISTGGGQQPRWRRDGKELFFVAPDRTLTAVKIGAAPRFEAEAPKALYLTHLLTSQFFGGDSYRYAPAPDGKKFLIITASEEPANTPLTAIVNWKRSR